MSWKVGEKGEYRGLVVGLWLRRRLGETRNIGTWLYGLLQSSREAMASAAAAPPPPATGAHSAGPLSFIGCMREASPPPATDQPPLHRRPHGLPTGEFAANTQHNHHGFDSMPKEPKKRRFHPLRGLRRIFRKKSRGAADGRLPGQPGSERAEINCSEHLRDREELTLRDPSGRADEIRSRSASELLTDSTDRDRLFARRRGLEESFAQLQRGGAQGQLSISHDSVFPGEVPNTRPLSCHDLHSSLERRTAKQHQASSNDVDRKDSGQRHRISLRVLEQIKTVIENRNQIAAAGSTASSTDNHHHNRFGRDKSDRGAAAAEDSHAKVSRKDAPTPTSTSTTDIPSSPIKEDLPELETGSLNHTAAHHRISVRPKNRRPPRRAGLARTDAVDSLEVAEAPEPAPAAAPASQPMPIVRKSSSRVSLSSGSEPAVSPDSLERGLEEEQERQRPRASPRSASRSPPDSLEAKPVAAARRSLLLHHSAADSLASDSALSRRPHRHKLLSKSTECFEPRPERPKRASLSELSLLASPKPLLLCHRSSDSLEEVAAPVAHLRGQDNKREDEEEDEEEEDDEAEEDKLLWLEPARPKRPKPRRLHKSSDSSDTLGSSDTLDSSETLDSLEPCCPEPDEQAHPGIDELQFWSSPRDSTHDIHLLAYTLVSRIQQQQQQQHHHHHHHDNGNGPEETDHHHHHHDDQLKGSDDSNTLGSTLNNLLSSKSSNEHLQNMINGNISDVSSNDNKSFKEKLIMFEKLGK